MRHWILIYFYSHLGMLEFGLWAMAALYSEMALDFRSTMGVGRLAPGPLEGEAQIEASEWSSGRREREEELDAEGEEQPLLLPAPPLVVAAGREGKGASHGFLYSSFATSTASMRMPAAGR